MEQHELDVELEKLIDSYSIFKVLCSLERVCNEKADYVAGGGSHGDPSPYMAAQWRKLAKKVEAAAKLTAGL